MNRVEEPIPFARHSIVYHDPTKWAAVPANNGANGPVWQWGDELLVGFTVGTFARADSGHQCTYDKPFDSWLAHSHDGGETWQAYTPANYQGQQGFRTEDAIPLPKAVDFASPGFVMRVEGDGYHGNGGRQWFYSQDKGVTWKGPCTFGSLLEHPELAGRIFTSRTAYLVNGPRDCFQSVNGFADLGYPRLYQRRDGQLVAVYFWCTPERPETHIEATIFSER